MAILHLLFGTNSLRNRIKRQSALLNADIEYATDRKNLLRLSAKHSATSPSGLGGAAALGFVFERFLHRPRRKKIVYVATPEPGKPLPAPRSWWMELLVPLAVSWGRDALLTHFHHKQKKPEDARVH